MYTPIRRKIKYDKIFLDSSPITSGPASPTLSFWDVIESLPHEAVLPKFILLSLYSQCKN
jgi:hypothetical protein